MNLPTATRQPLSTQALTSFVDEQWDQTILPALTDYIRIPAKSPMFDGEWAAHGLLDKVVCDAAAWVEGQKIRGLKLEVLRLPGRTPLLFFEVASTHTSDTRSPDHSGTVLLYGHLDKQPEFNGWRHGLGPWTPKLENGLLYGRGGADDGCRIRAASA
jgi:acetylornithine deacetylase/succinyl-diaminopimelate desuccinylase-like protein